MNRFRLHTRLHSLPRRGGTKSARSLWAAGDAGEVSSSSAPAAVPVPVPVPWRVVRRSAAGVIEVEQCAETPLFSARFALAGDGMLGLSLPRTVLPGERLRVVARGTYRSDLTEDAQHADTMLILRWFQPDGTELLWPISLE